VLSVLLALTIIVAEYKSFPTRQIAFDSLKNTIGEWATCEQYNDDMKAGRDNSSTECSTYSEQHVAEKIKGQVAGNNTLYERQAWFVAERFGLWAGLNLIAYLIIITCRWVYRGFRPKAV